MSDLPDSNEAVVEKGAEDKTARRRAYEKRYYQKNKAHKLEYAKQWKANNPEKNAAHRRKSVAVFAAKHPERVAQIRRNQYLKIKQDPVRSLAAKMHETLKITIRVHLGKRAGGYSQKILRERLGCTSAELIAHINRQLSPGMTWENYGVWVVARKKPFATATTIQEVEQLAHYSNCYPVWLAEHLNRVGGVRRIPQQAST